MAIATYDMTAANAALKELYDGQVIENLVYKQNPFYAMVPKDTKSGGKSIPIPIEIGVPQGGSADFATAQLNQTAAVLKSFQLTLKKDYQVATIDRQTLLAAETDKMAFVDSAKVEIDGAIRAVSLSIASAMFRSGTGSIGQIGSISSGVITLTNAGDVVQFELNQTLQATTTDGGSLRGSAANLGYVIAVDRTAGTVTVSATGLGGSAGTPSTVSAWVANDFLLRQGDLNVKMSGLSAWVPATAPTSTPFYGVDRSVDPVRLGGVRYDGSAQSVEEALIDASQLVAREGGNPDHCFMSYGSFAALEKSLGSKAIYINETGPANVAFTGIRVQGAYSTIKVLPDRNCPPKVAYLLQLDTWKLRSLDSAPHLQKDPDGTMLRVYNLDAGEVRVSSYHNLACSAPGWNAQVALGA